MWILKLTGNYIDISLLQVVTTFLHYMMVSLLTWCWLLAPLLVSEADPGLSQERRGLGA